MAIINNIKDYVMIPMISVGLMLTFLDTPGDHRLHRMMVFFVGVPVIFNTVEMLITLVRYLVKKYSCPTNP